MKAGIFDPYLDTIGGGERYCLSIAEALLSKGWRVDIFWLEDKEIKQKLINKFSLKIDRVNFIPYSPRINSLFKRYKFERSYDLLFYFSDGSIPFMFGRKNLLHFQIPFKNVLRKTLLNSVKLDKISNLVCNSLFTKKIIDKALGKNSDLVYPPVDVELFKPLVKKNTILSVGRFSQLLQNKKQDVLIETFIKNENNIFKGWELVLAGGSEIGAIDFVKKLRTLSKGHKVKIVENPSFEELVKIYGEAKIYWSASGFGVDEEDQPEKVEHFGISTVEAMAAGCVPVVLGKGGQREIINDEVDGFLWETTDQLTEKTRLLIDNSSLRNKLSKAAIIKSKNFSKEHFYKKIYEIS